MNEILSKDTKIVFFSAIKVPYGGGRQLFLDYGSYLADKLGYEVYYITYYDGMMEQDFAHSKMRMLNALTVDFSELDGAVYFVALNHMSHLLTHIKDHKRSRICPYFGHPQIIPWYTRQFDSKYFDVSELYGMFHNIKGACFQDSSNLVAAEKMVDYTFPPIYVPTIIHAESCSEEIGLIPPDPENRLRILWLGRLDSDKIYSIINCLDNLMTSNLPMKIDFHIVGDGNSKGRIDIRKYSPHIRFIFTSYLYGKDRDDYIKANADFVMAMGISAMDCATLGIPTVIPPLAPEPFAGNNYVYIFDVPDFSVGWNESDLKDLGCPTYTIKEIVDTFYQKPENRIEYGRRGKEFCLSEFSIEKGVQLLMEALAQAELTAADCMRCKSLVKQLKQYDLYRKIRKGTDFSDFIYNMGQINRLHTMKFGEKISFLWKKAIDVISNHGNKKASKKQRTLFEKDFRSYEDKIAVIREKYSDGRPLKVAFLVLFNGVFPFGAVFEKMLADPRFDPWIIIIPNTERDDAYRHTKYFEAFNDMSCRYGDRVLHGYDWERGSFLELEDTYPLVFFCNPYENLVHPYHHINYFLKQDVLTLYANYGFAALKYWDEVIDTPFYNQVWRISIETESNIQYLKEHELLKGKNGLATGYLKADGLVNYKPTPGRTRKKILICPHHTVWGWDKLSISHFVEYSEYFLELAQKHPEVDFVFRPHPLLFDNLVSHNVWPQSAVDEYLVRIQSQPNMVYDKSGDYFQAFIDSDAMIHDCGSFIGEYLFTAKPCCYMVTSLEKTYEGLVPLGKQCMDQYYHAFSKKDIDYFVDQVVLQGEDPKKEQREAFSEDVLKKHYPHAADRLIEEIERYLFD